MACTLSNESSPDAQPSRSLRGGYWWKMIATLRSAGGVRRSRAQFSAQRTTWRQRSGTGRRISRRAPVTGSMPASSRVPATVPTIAPSNSGCAMFTDTSIGDTPCTVSSHSARGL